MKTYSPLLINEPPLQVLPTLAKKIGLNEAILLQQLHYWMGRASHYDKGKPWVWNSIREWQEQLPFFSEKTIERGLKSLRDGCLVEALPLSANKMDKRLYYTLRYEKLNELLTCDDSPKTGNAQRQYDRMHNVNMTERDCQSDGIYTETSPENTYIDYPPTNSNYTTAVADTGNPSIEIEEEDAASHTECVEEGLVGGQSKNISFAEPAPASRSAAQTDAYYDGGSFMEDEDTCPNCQGQGYDKISPDTDCPKCNGLGYLVSDQQHEETVKATSTLGAVDTTAYGRLVVGGAAKAKADMPSQPSTSPNPGRKVLSDAIPLPAPEIAVGLASYEAWPDNKIYAHCIAQYKWDTAWIEALRGYYAKAKSNPLRYVRDMCLRRISLTLELEAMGQRDEKPRELKLHHDVTRYDDPERLAMLEAEKKRQAEADARAEEKAKVLFGKGRRIRSGS